MNKTISVFMIAICSLITSCIYAHQAPEHSHNALATAVPVEALQQLIIDYMHSNGTDWVERKVIPTEQNLMAVTFLPDNEHVAYACKSGIVKICRLSDQKIIREIQATAPDDHIHSLSLFSRTMLALATGTKFVVWDITNLDNIHQAHSIEKPIDRWSPARGGSHSFNQLAKLLASAVIPMRISIWQLPPENTSQMPITIPCAHGEASELTFSPCGKYLATGGLTGNNILIWDVNTKKQIQKLELNMPRALLNIISQLIWLPDNTLVATQNNTLHTWQLLAPESNRFTAQTYKKVDISLISDSIDKIVSIPHTQALAVVGSNSAQKQITLLDRDTVKTLFETTQDTIHTIAVSPNGQYLAAALTNSVKIWENPNTQIIASLGAQNAVKKKITQQII
jgi:WD40 repeat protein